MAAKGAMDPRTFVTELFKDYVSATGQVDWPWEMNRWNELVFCILSTFGSPDVLSATARHVTNTLSDFELLNIEKLASLRRDRDAEASRNPVYVTIDTLLQQAGFSPDRSRTAIDAISGFASVIQDKYDGKIQNYLRRYGTLMIEGIEKDLGQSDPSIRSAFTFWLQDVANMPVPALDPVCELACKELGYDYANLIEIASDHGINIALFDDALRFYWETKAQK